MGKMPLDSTVNSLGGRVKEGFDAMVEGAYVGEQQIPGGNDTKKGIGR
jgi:hypothetical protein